MSTYKFDEQHIFRIARGIGAAQLRSEYLDQVCTGNQTLRERVEALLLADGQETDFLKTGLADRQQESTEAHISFTEQPGTTIGRYRLMEQIGEGGMGTVFIAQQGKPIRRMVALKVIKPGMDSKSVVARFEAERQALAMMDHPNIAKVLDAGTTESGRPFFAMELVKGVPITEYCDRNKLTIRERLQLFVQVCQAIQHAHQKGIIHRDIKPSNVLVTMHDGKPVPKVIDFGVAKALNARLTDKTIYTAHLQIVGTLLYMSPEQAELGGLDVDTRSDVYSLGVLLYELLTGTTPFQKGDLEQAGFDEKRRIIREKEPPRASIRISSLGESATTVAEHRQTEAKKLSQLVRRDLDWIVLKSLEKDRTRRYETALGFAEDVERYLADVPVEARPPSWRYRFGKFVKRHRAAVITAALFIIALVSAFSMILWQYSETRRAYASLRESLFDQGLAHAFSGNPDAAEQVVDKLKSLPDFGEEAELLDAFLMISNEEYDAAIETLESGSRLPNSVAAYSLLTYAHEGKGDLPRYFNCHHRLANMQPKSVKERFFKAMNYGVDPKTGIDLLEEAIQERKSPVFKLFHARLQADWAMQTGQTGLIDSINDELKATEFLGYRGNAGAEAFRTIVTLIYIAKQKPNNQDEIDALTVKAAEIAGAPEFEIDRGYWNRLFLANLYYADGEFDQARKCLENAALEHKNFATPFYFSACFDTGKTPDSNLLEMKDSNNGYVLSSQLYYAALTDQPKSVIDDLANTLLEADCTIDCHCMALSALAMAGWDRSELREKAKNVRERWAEKEGDLTPLERGWRDDVLGFYASDQAEDVAAANLIRNGEDSQRPNFNLAFYYQILGDYFVGQEKYSLAKDYYRRAVDQHVIYCTGYWWSRAVLNRHPRLKEW